MDIIFSLGSLYDEESRIKLFRLEIDTFFSFSVMSWVLDLIRESRLACALGSEEFGWEKREAVGCQAISHLVDFVQPGLRM